MRIITSEGKIEISRKHELIIEVEDVVLVKQLKVGERVNLISDNEIVITNGLIREPEFEPSREPEFYSESDTTDGSEYEASKDSDCESEYESSEDLESELYFDFSSKVTQSFFNNNYQVMFDIMLRIFFTISTISIDEYIERRIAQGWSKCTIFFDGKEYDALKIYDYYDLTPVKKIPYRTFGPEFNRFWRYGEITKLRREAKRQNKMPKTAYSWDKNNVKLYLPIIIKKLK